MLIYSISVSVDGFINDREGGFQWTAPDDELFAFHAAEVKSLGAYLLGRRLYEAMRVWETDPGMRVGEGRDAFADAWCELPKVVFSRTLDRVEGNNTRLARGSVEEEVREALGATDSDVSIGGAGLAAGAMGRGLIDELRIFRCPIVAGGGTQHLPAATEPVPLGLLETRRFGSGVVYERYGRSGDGRSGARRRDSANG